MLRLTIAVALLAVCGCVSSQEEQTYIPEFANAGQKDGLEIWRVEDFVPVPWSKPGSFHTGDSYIILETANDRRIKNVYYWIGDESSQDEYGAAAIMAVQLQGVVHGTGRISRELQRRESDAFRALFQKKIDYLDGGVESGFNHVN